MRWPSARRATIFVVAAAGALTSCSAAAVPPPGATSTQQPATADVTATRVQQAITRFNAAAGGPVSRQQQALAGLVDAGQRSVQRRCATATSTITFEPVYARLAPAPGWKPAEGTLSGTVYELPTLIRIHTGNRITGTDLTDLHVAVHGDRAWLPALCLN